MFNFILTHSPLFYLTQSLWRDEAFSILVAEKPILSVIGKLSFEPPVYYILLHFWIKIFGETEIAARSLSLLGFSLATCVVIFWAEKLFKKHWLSWFLPIFFFFNPMLLYYAFEIRAYGWLMFFATLSLYAYSSKKYWLCAVANILAFYTHSYAIFLPFVQTIHYVIIHSQQKNFYTPKHIFKDIYTRSLIFVGIVLLPWLLFLYTEATKMKTSWYFPVDIQLVKSVLGNMFIGYDGTPGGMWGATTILSAIIVGFCWIAFRNKQERKETSFFLLMIFLPLVIVIGISFIKPLFVNRYLIYVTISEVIILGIALQQIKKPFVQKIVALFLLLFIIGIDIVIPKQKAKLDIRSTIQEANTLRGPNDVLFVNSPLIFFEAEYYTKDREHVYLYNPDHGVFPWYVGDMAFSPSQMAVDLPDYPTRAFIVGQDQSITIAYKANAKTTTNHE